MQTPVAVTGLGIISPLGNSIEEFWQNCINGKTGIGPVTRFDASRLESRIAAEVKNFDASQWIDKKEDKKNALFTQFPDGLLQPFESHTGRSAGT